VGKALWESTGSLPFTLMEDKSHSSSKLFFLLPLWKRFKGFARFLPQSLCANGSNGNERFRPGSPFFPFFSVMTRRRRHFILPISSFEYLDGFIALTPIFLRKSRCCVAPFFACVEIKRWEFLRWLFPPLVVLFSAPSAFLFFWSRDIPSYFSFPPLQAQKKINPLEFLNLP